MKVLVFRFLVLTSFLVAAVSYGAIAETGDVVLVNGAFDIVSNSRDFYNDLSRGTRVFKGWNQSTLSANGDVPASELNGLAKDNNGITLYNGDGSATLVHYSAPHAKAADLETLETQVKGLVAKPSGQPLVLYFTDHGYPGNTSLWGREELSVNRLKDILEIIPSGRKTILIFDHCYSGSMIQALFNEDGKIRRNACAFSSTDSNEMSTSGQSIMRFADKQGNKFGNFGALIHEMRFIKKMDSTAMASSDVFLQKYLSTKGLKAAGGVPVTQVKQSCVFRDSTANDALLLLDEPMRVLAQHLLTSQRSQLKFDLQAALKRSGLKPTCKIDDVEKALRNLQARISEADLKDGRYADDRSIAVTQFIQRTVGSDQWRKYNKLHDTIDDLQEKLEEKPSSEGEKEIRKELEQAVSEYTPIYDRVQLAKASTINRNYGPFKAFVKKNAKSGGWNPLILTLFDRQDDDLNELMIEQRKLRRLDIAIKDSEALDLIVQNRDQEAMSEYIGLLECESTSIRGGG